MAHLGGASQFQQLYRAHGFMSIESIVNGDYEPT